MASTHSLNKKPYRRVLPDEWIAIEALYRAGATAKALGPGGRIALVGATMADARAVMVEGPSGLLALPFREGARFEPSLRRVIFPGGAVGMLFSAEEPERLRGPQFHATWGDELCAWSRGAETLAMRRLRLLLGARPRVVLTSTPRPTRLLRGVLAEPGLARTDAPTRANADNLAPQRRLPEDDGRKASIVERARPRPPPPPPLAGPRGGATGRRGQRRSRRPR